jgi:hypothetical protein
VPSALIADRLTPLKLGRTPGLVALFRDLKRLTFWLSTALQRRGEHNDTLRPAA